MQENVCFDLETGCIDTDLFLSLICASTKGRKIDPSICESSDSLLTICFPFRGFSIGGTAFFQAISLKGIIAAQDCAKEKQGKRVSSSSRPNPVREFLGK